MADNRFVLQLRDECRSIVVMCDQIESEDCAEYLDLITHSLRLCQILVEEAAATPPAVTRSDHATN